MIDKREFKKIILDNTNTRIRNDKPLLVLYHNYLYLSKSFIKRLDKSWKYVIVSTAANCVQLEFSEKNLQDSIKLQIQSHIYKNTVIEYGKIGNVELCYKLSEELGLNVDRNCYYKTNDYEYYGNIYQFKFDRTKPSYRKNRK